MRIASVEIKRDFDGLKPFLMDDLSGDVVLAGENGSGKTRLLKRIEKVIKALKSDAHCIESAFMEIQFADDAGKPIRNDNEPYRNATIINYSHSDLPLQSSRGFPPYVIDVSKSNLEREGVAFEQTALESLLYLTRLVKYSPETERAKFNSEYCLPLLGTELVPDETGEPTLFGRSISDLSKAPLSPGQKYILRLCVALYCNIIPEGAILFLDEPESHLHPKTLLDIFDKLKNNFKLGQMWIATHSVELIARFYYRDIWYMDRGKAEKIGSKTEKILNGMLGDEEKRFQLYQFVSSPDAFACNVFAVECLSKPEVIQKVSKSDPSTALARAKMRAGDVVVDFGAGKGRFLESYHMQPEKVDITYYAYDGYSIIERGCSL